MTQIFFSTKSVTNPRTLWTTFTHLLEDDERQIKLASLQGQPQKKLLKALVIKKKNSLDLTKNLLKKKLELFGK